MGIRRMFTKEITSSDAYLDLPHSTRSLYTQLVMNADDEGFVNNPKTLQRLAGSTDEDLQILIQKKFIISFDSGVVVVKHWFMHNAIRNDRKKATNYVEERSKLYIKENGAYSLIQPSDNQVTTKCQPSDNQVTTKCQPSDNQVTAQDKISKDKISKDNNNNIKDIMNVNCKEVFEAYNQICTRLPRIKSMSEARKKAVKARLNNYSLEDVKEMFKKANESDFLTGMNDKNWIANFDWLMKDTNFAKVMDGNYENRNPKQTQSQQNYVDPEIWG